MSYTRSRKAATELMPPNKLTAPQIATAAISVTYCGSWFVVRATSTECKQNALASNKMYSFTCIRDVNSTRSCVVITYALT